MVNDYDELPEIVNVQITPITSLLTNFRSNLGHETIISQTYCKSLSGHN